MIDRIKIDLTYHALERIELRTGLNEKQFYEVYHKSDKPMLSREEIALNGQLKNKSEVDIMYIEDLRLYLLGKVDKGRLVVLTVIGEGE